MVHKETDMGRRTRAMLGRWAPAIGLAAALTAGGCSNAGQGAASGAGLGAAAGAIIGSVTGSAGKGALIGAAAGAVGGAVVGDQNARRERDRYHDDDPDHHDNW